jgi:hypothetical protein
LSANQVSSSLTIRSQFISLDTWLITNGCNVGIVQLIGQAIRKRKLTKPQDKIVAIGVCNYGCIKNVSDVQRPEYVFQSKPLDQHSVSIQIEVLINNIFTIENYGSIDTG